MYLYTRWLLEDTLYLHFFALSLYTKREENTKWNLIFKFVIVTIHITWQ